MEDEERERMPRKFLAHQYESSQAGEGRESLSQLLTS